MNFSELQMDERFHLKGWGSEYWIVNNEKYCGKLLYFNAGCRCSWHYHKVKDETFFVHGGLLEVKTGWDDDIEEAKTVILGPGQSLHIPVGLRHQMKALGEDVIMYEFSTQHMEEDSYRIIKGD